ncbi:MAG TPA: tetratricopeptide repeat protein [Micropepsaceae bacterium]|nr:tetratricopeptide repeat protein [Micropepsaceae bacterium]
MKARLSCAVMAVALCALTAHAQETGVSEAPGAEAPAPGTDEFETGFAAFASGDYSTALLHWEPLAEDGDPRALYNIGLLYAQGWGVSKDMAIAMDLWLKAARQNHVRAAHNLALALLAGEPADGSGQLGEPDTAQAVKWLEIGVNAGYANSEYTLGKLFAEGIGVTRDPSRAAELFQMAAEQGFARAQYNLGKIYRDGDGVAKSPELSIHWFREAAERGHARAQDKLADRYARGDGVPQDDIEALKWAILAAAHGYAPAAERRDELRARMPEDSIEEAERRAAEFRPREGAVEG